MKIVTIEFVELTPTQRTALLKRRQSMFKIEYIANQIGCNPRTLRSWEYGERRPTIDKYRRWREALQLPDEEIVLRAA